MRARLEHANIAVRDPEAVAAFLMTAFPHYRVRHRGTKENGDTWMHVGSDDDYVSLEEASGKGGSERTLYGDAPGINHLAWVVDDVDAVRQRLRDAGYLDSTIPNDHPHRRRIYFHDPTGLDWEFVQYLSDDPSERHDYAIA